MRAIREHLVGNRIYQLALFVFEDMQLDQICSVKGLSIDGVGTMVSDPWQESFNVEDCAFGGTDGVIKGLEGQGAVVERETFEGVVWGVCFGKTGAGAG